MSFARKYKRSVTQQIKTITERKQRKAQRLAFIQAQKLLAQQLEYNANQKGETSHEKNHHTVTRRCHGHRGDIRVCRRCIRHQTRQAVSQGGLQGGQGQRSAEN